VDAARLETFVASLFRAAGCSQQDAALIARLAVTTDLRGAYSHGTALVPGYLARMADSKIDPRGRPRVVRDEGAALVVDGGNSLGHVGLTFGMEQAIERAATSGIAAVAVGGSNHCGAMAPYAMQALPHDMIGIATTNGLPTMAWWGGLDRILSINPIGVAIPTGQATPIVLDTSFGAAARGKVVVQQQRGEPLPEGWATDADGQPTLDPEAALAGLIQPAGGYKGTGMALLMGILAAPLSGAAYGTELGDFVSGPTPGRDGQFGMAIRVSAFEDPARFKARADGIVAQIHTSRLAPGVDRVWVPGERAVDTERRYRAEGIPIMPSTIESLRAAAARLGVDPDPLVAA
jgi:LDH2 family malate/lactate/ureidoglycolate dehydrogenase